MGMGWVQSMKTHIEPLGWAAPVLILVAAMLTACGGGSSSKTSTPEVSACGGAAPADSCAGADDSPEPATQTTASLLTAASFDGIPQDGLTLGSANAPVTLDLYQNFICPHCKDFALEALPSLIADYVQSGRVRLVFHDVAFGGAIAETAHDAARCAADQGKFWPAYAVLYENFSQDDADYTKDNLESMLSVAGVDVPQLTACLASDQHLAEVKSSTDAFTHLPDTDTSLANDYATAEAAQKPGIPLLALAAHHLIAPDSYAEVRTWLQAALGQ